jgi:hypothetical protein
VVENVKLPFDRRQYNSQHEPWSIPAVQCLCPSNANYINIVRLPHLMSSFWLVNNVFWFSVMCFLHYPPTIHLIRLFSTEFPLFVFHLFFFSIMHKLFYVTKYIQTYFIEILHLDLNFGTVYFHFYISSSFYAILYA